MTHFQFAVLGIALLPFPFSHPLKGWPTILGTTILEYDIVAVLQFIDTRMDDNAKCYNTREIIFDAGTPSMEPRSIALLFSDLQHPLGKFLPTSFSATYCIPGGYPVMSFLILSVGGVCQWEGRKIPYMMMSPSHFVNVIAQRFELFMG